MIGIAEPQQLDVLDRAATDLGGIAASLDPVTEIDPGIDADDARLLGGEIDSRLAVIRRVRGLLAGRAGEHGSPEPQPCPRCAHLDEYVTDLEAERDRLAARVAELEARPLIVPDRAAEPGPAEDAQQPEQAAGGHACAACRRPGAALAWELQADGTKRSAYVCGPCLAAAAAEHPACTYSREEPEDPPPTSEAEVDGLLPELDFEDTSTW